MSASQISKTPASKPHTWELVAIARSESGVASAIGCHEVGVALNKEKKNEVSKTVALDLECYFMGGDSEHQLWLCSQNNVSLGRVSIQALDPPLSHGWRCDHEDVYN